MKRPSTPILTVDGIIVDGKKVLLVKRNHSPFIGYWVLPGGHVDYGERVEQALTREMKEELGVGVEIKKLFGVYSDPKRDPRYHTTSVVYVCTKNKGKIKIDYEASDFKFFSLDALPEKIGFDHQKVLNDFKQNNT